jgi:hypothetical protein
MKLNLAQYSSFIRLSDHATTGGGGGCWGWWEDDSEPAGGSAAETARRSRRADQLGKRSRCNGDFQNSDTALIQTGIFRRDLKGRSTEFPTPTTTRAPRLALSVLRQHPPR